MQQAHSPPTRSRAVGPLGSGDVLQATIEAFSSPVAVLDQRGDIVAANAAWLVAAPDGEDARCPIGESYLDWCRLVCNEPAGGALARSVNRVLLGGRRSCEQTCGDSGSAETVRITVREIERQAPRRFLVAHETSGPASAADIENRLLAGQMEERQRLAGELHDSVGQNLVAVGLSLARLRRESAPHDGLMNIVEEMDEALQQTHVEIRTLSFLLQAPSEEEPGAIEIALRDLATGFARRAGLRAEVRVETLRCPLCRGRQLTLYRILQEALVNVHRHAQATAITVELAKRNRHLVLQVRDDGRGLPGPEGAPPRAGVGIASMRARLRKFGGDLCIVSDGGGTTITAKLPLDERSDRRQ